MDLYARVFSSYQVINTSRFILYYVILCKFSHIHSKVFFSAHGFFSRKGFYIYRVFISLFRISLVSFILTYIKQISLLTYHHHMYQLLIFFFFFFFVITVAVQANLCVLQLISHDPEINSCVNL